MKWKSKSNKRKRQLSAQPNAPRATKVLRRSADGKLRLAQYPDGNTGKQVWRLQVPMFEQAWQNALSESAANITVKTFELDPTLRGALKVAREAMNAFSQMCNGWLAQDTEGLVACKAGCGHCCHQPVAITLLEAFTIVDHLERTWNRQQLVSLTQHLADRRKQVAGLTQQEQYSPSYPCVFLKDGSCSIYGVRPIVCRGMNSLDAEECRKRLHDAAVKAEFFEQGGGACYQEPIQGAHAMVAGLDLGLNDVFGIDMQRLSLTDAVHRVLTDPELKRRWIMGEGVTSGG